MCVASHETDTFNDDLTLCSSSRLVKLPLDSLPYIARFTAFHGTMIVILILTLAPYLCQSQDAIDIEGG